LANKGRAPLGTPLKGGYHFDVDGIAHLIAKHGRGEEDGREDVVEVVGDPRREHPDALEPLDPEELLLQVLLGGDVRPYAQAGLGLAGVVPYQGHAQLQDERLAVPVVQQELAAPFARFRKGLSRLLQL
jgi:hypothetical protein